MAIIDFINRQNKTLKGLERALSYVMNPAKTEKHLVTGIDALWFNDKQTNNYNFIKKDLFDTTDQDVIGHDVAIFLGGLSNDPMAEFSPSANFIHNISQPLFLAYLCKKMESINLYLHLRVQHMDLQTTKN